MAPRGAAARSAGYATLETVLDDLRPLVDKTAALRAKPRRTVDVVVDLADGRQLRGTVGGLHETHPGRGVVQQAGRRRPAAGLDQRARPDRRPIPRRPGAQQQSAAADPGTRNARH